MTTYDVIGATYSSTRQPDPKIAGHIIAALGDARTVINVGAGTGSYEPAHTILAVEPSDTMISQRPKKAAPTLRAFAESIPLPDCSADAAMALLTVHHWSDLEAGISELRRIARKRVVILTWDQRVFQRFWLLREYLPEAAAFDAARAIPLDRLETPLGGARIEAVPVPHDCADGFLAAYWRRPNAYLDPMVRAGISLFAQLEDRILRPGLDRLATDIASGHWHRKHADLMTMKHFDAGYRLIVAEL